MQPVNVKLSGGGSNWLTVMSTLAQGLRGYSTRLPRGSVVTITAGDPYTDCQTAPQDVVAGKYDIAVTTPSWYASLALNGKPPYKKKLPIRCIANFPHDDAVAFAMRSHVPLKGLGDIAAKKYPLKFSAPPPEMNHPVTWIIDAILTEYGSSMEQIQSWGGKWLLDRPMTLDKSAPPISEESEMLMDEAIMTPKWKNLVNRYDVTFLPVDEPILARLEKRGMWRKTIAKGRFPKLDHDVETVDMSGWCLLCSESLPDQIAYEAVRGIHSQMPVFNHRIPRDNGLTADVTLHEITRHLPVPLHPGAERYYREQGVAV